MFNFFKKKKVLKPAEVIVNVPAAGSLAEQIKLTLPKDMHLPKELEALFDWISENNFTWERDGEIGGALMAYGTSKAALAPYVEFSAEGSDNLKYWFGVESDEIKERLYVFCKTGGDGSMGAFWLDDEGQQKIVHLGSGSGSTMVCVLTDNAVDFLRLLAIGYDEICWGGFNEPPTGDTPVNTKFRQWVETEFSTDIPACGNEIVKETAEMGDEDKSSDPFLQWTSRVNAH